MNLSGITVFLAFFLLQLGNSGFAGEVKQPKKSEDAREIEVNLSTMGNDISFDAKSLQIPFGAEILLLFKNKADKDSEILHNIAVLRPGTTDKVLKAFEDAGYDVDKLKGNKDLLAVTPALAPGESSTIRLTTKMLDKPGFYPYVCLMPGHADMLGMKGLLNVVKK